MVVRIDGSVDLGTYEFIVAVHYEQHLSQVTETVGGVVDVFEGGAVLSAPD